MGEGAEVAQLLVESDVFVKEIILGVDPISPLCRPKSVVDKDAGNNWGFVMR